MNQIRKRVLLSSYYAAALATPAFADTAKLEEVVVTAERREASMQNVPISVTAINTAGLENKQVIDVISLTKIVPGMTAKPTLTPLEISIAIRGVTQLIPTVNVDPAIGSYVDGVYNVVNAGSNNAMVDMERVEVLKGPQGTLFGRNTIGGAISITTAKPTDDFSGYISAAKENYDGQTYEGVINGALVPGTLAGRLVYQHTEHNGYGKNTTLGTDTNTLNQDYVRGALKLTPTDGWEILGSGFYTDAFGNSSANRLGYLDATSSLAPGLLPPTSVLIPALSGNPGDSLANYVNKGGFYDDAGNLKSQYHLRQYGGTATITGELSDAVTLKSITAYSQTDYNTISDLDGTPYIVLELVGYPIKAKQYSQELQFYGKAMDDRLSWITGAYYFHVDASQISTARVLSSLSTLFGTPLTHNEGGPNPAIDSSGSVFAQMDYALTPDLKLTAGARYVKDKREIEYTDHVVSGIEASGAFVSCNLANAPGDTNPANCDYKDSVSYHYIPWTVGLDYKLNQDMMIYGKISQGYRSGAFIATGPAGTVPNPASGISPSDAAAANAFALSSFKPVDPEKMRSYELGSKLEMLDSRLRVNAAVYWSEYDNIQTTQNLTSPCATCTPPAILINSGTAHIWGGELETTALIENLQLDASVGYTHPEYVDGVLKGTDLINISKLNYSVGASYPIDFSLGTLTLGTTYSYRSEAQFYTLSPGLPESVAKDQLTQKGYGLLDARASLVLASLPLEFALYGQNLANKEYAVSAQSFAPPLSYASSFAGVPRTYGMSMKYKF